ncbi:MAG TPA: hypothetical protein VK968_04850, partial [Roseimicrobium sp.]|nr:hypothetical protein [Roseimicrobium sp.]
MDFFVYASLVVVGLLFGLFAGKRLFARTDGMQPLARYAAALLPMVIAVVAGQWIAEWLLAPQLIWNGARLAPSFALSHGSRLYYGPEAGLVSGHIYGPVSVLLCLPATLFNTPSAAIRAA